MSKITRAEAYANAIKVWKIVEDAVGYGFNSSHAYAVALDSIYGAYLKANYPLDYYSTVLNIYEGNTSKQGEIFDELKKFNIVMKPIEFGKSSSKYIKDSGDNSIYKGLSSIKYLNSKVAEELYELAKNKEFCYTDSVGLFKAIIENTGTNTRQMNILIRLGYFKKFGDAQVLLEIFQCMTDVKKPDIKKYPEFANKELIVDKKNKKGEVRQELKIIKKPLKYSTSLKQETKDERLENLREYEAVVRLSPPKTYTIYEQILFEKENLGYSVSVYPELARNIVLVMDINTKYTPVVTLLRLCDGETIISKVKKGKMYDEFDGQFLDTGDVIKISDTHYEYGWKKIDEEWVRNEDKKELFLDKIKVLRKGEEK